ISGIDSPAPISITGGSYSIGCTGTFVTTAGTITNNQTVCVRLTAAGTNNTLTTATLSVGSLSRAFAAITLVPGTFSTSPALSTYDHHVLALRSDGRLLSWGSGAGLAGAVGPGATAFPRPIPGISGVVNIAAGPGYNVVVRSDGSVWSWGSNPNNGLGQGAGVSSVSAPQLIQGLDLAEQAVALGGAAFVRRAGGSVWGWGGVLGATPVAVSGLAGVVEISRGAGNSLLARDMNGIVWTWSQSTGMSVVSQVNGIANAASISGGIDHNLVVLTDGRVMSWGGNGNGQLGRTGNPAIPDFVPGLNDIQKVSAGNFYSLALRATGGVLAWGWNRDGQTGVPSLAQSESGTSTPLPVGINVPVESIHAGLQVGLAVLSDGMVMSWGTLDFGTIGRNYSTLGPTFALGMNGEGNLSLQLGAASGNAFYFTPQFGVGPAETVVSNTIVIGGLFPGLSAELTVAGGEVSVNGGVFSASPQIVVNGDSVRVRVVSSSSGLATTSAATVRIGPPGSGPNQLQSNTFYVRTRETSASQAVVPKAVLGDAFTLILTSEGTVFGTGYNGNGQLANGSTFSRPKLLPVPGLGGVLDIAAGRNHALILRKGARTVGAFGYNGMRQLGGADVSPNVLRVLDVPGISQVIALTAGDFHSLALKDDGTVWAWGSNVDGQIGQGSTATVQYAAPTQVKGVGGGGFLTGVVAITSGGRHNLAVLVDGSVVAWGNNASGQLGNNSTVSSSSPVVIGGLSNIVAVAAGGAHSLALKNDATVLAWGDNAFGQLGVNDTNNRLTPAAIPGLTQIGRLAAGATHSIAIKTGGVLFTWGNNANRQLDYFESGQMATPSANRTSPTPLTSVTNVIANSSFFAIAAGGRHSMGLKTNGQIYLWGDNAFGQLGNKSGNFNPHSGNLNLLRGDAGIAAFAGAVITSIGGSSSSGTSIVNVDGLATGYDFGNLNPNPSPAPVIDGSFKNNDLTQVVSGVDVAVENSSGSAFAVNKLNCNPALNANEECTFRVTFNPTIAGDYAGTLKVIADLPGSPEVRTLFGKAIAPASPGLKITSTGTAGSNGYLLFESKTIGSTSDPQNIVIQNVGTATLTVSSASVTQGAADFSLPSPNACATVAAGASCNLPVLFNPTGPNERDGTVTLTTNVAGSTNATITLRGVADSTTAPLPTYTVTVAKAGNAAGTGTVTSTAPASPTINCGATCNATWTTGSTVTLTANPGANSSFTNWSGVTCNGGNTSTTCTFTLTANTNITATFTLNTYAVSGAANPMAGGSVNCTSPVNHGATTTCTATPAMGYTLTNISGCGGTSSSTSPYTTGPITAACTVTANFTLSATVPNAPTIGTATAGNGQVTIAFTAPMNDGSSPITSYTATCGGQSASGANSPITVTGLTNGTPINCTVVATNAIGSSPPSTASNSVTPAAPTITLQSVQSKKTHGSAGDQLLAVAQGIPITGAITIEPRDARRGHTLIFDFGTPISAAGSAGAIDNAAQPIGMAYPRAVGNTIEVTLIGIPDNRRVTVQLSGINGFGTAAVSLGFLVGDVNGTGKVNGADVSAVKSRVTPSTVNASNFKFDLNQNGVIDAGDLMMVKGRAGWMIP
ncbi:MAG: choice-of-anchor D domain-containing protein, partial [Betaproteobacteria bacterium]|nr:choice-of-anchor D domain-containing protein [Betaproteobacteria bacterium]